MSTKSGIFPPQGPGVSVAKLTSDILLRRDPKPRILQKLQLIEEIDKNTGDKRKIIENKLLMLEEVEEILNSNNPKATEIPEELAVIDCQIQNIRKSAKEMRAPCFFKVGRIAHYWGNVANTKCNVHLDAKVEELESLVKSITSPSTFEAYRLGKEFAPLENEAKELLEALVLSARYNGYIPLSSNEFKLTKLLDNMDMVSPELIKTTCISGVWEEFILWRKRSKEVLDLKPDEFLYVTSVYKKYASYVSQNIREITDNIPAETLLPLARSADKERGISMTLRAMLDSAEKMVEESSKYLADYKRLSKKY